MSRALLPSAAALLARCARVASNDGRKDAGAGSAGRSCASPKSAACRKLRPAEPTGFTHTRGLIASRPRHTATRAVAHPFYLCASGQQRASRAQPIVAVPHAHLSGTLP